MRNSDTKEITVRRLRTRMVWQTVGIVIGAVCMFELVEYFTHIMMPSRKGVAYDPIDGIGMIVPMSLIVGFMFRRTLKNMNRYFGQLIDGINGVAGGDFSFKLDPKKGGPYRAVFENFNKMTGELGSVQTLRDDFVNQFSHEFKTPISSISGFARLLQEKELPPEKQSQYLEIIGEEATRLSDLSGTVMLLSELENQRMIPDRTYYSLDEQIKECVILLAPEWGLKHLDLDGEDLMPVVYLGNGDIMKQVWINLINNAVKYSPEGGKITLSLKKEGKEAVFSVEDQGPGISEEDREKIFQKYFQSKSNGRVMSSKGLGLGLSIVKRILTLCGGRIEVESRAGQGSKFTVFLPL